jgi:hypothetical protein
MPVQKCTQNGDPGFSWGPNGKCYIYKVDDHQAARVAYIRALQQGEAIQKSGGK